MNSSFALRKFMMNRNCLHYYNPKVLNLKKKMETNEEYFKVKFFTLILVSVLSAHYLSIVVFVMSQFSFSFLILFFFSNRSWNNEKVISRFTHMQWFQLIYLLLYSPNVFVLLPIVSCFDDMFRSNKKLWNKENLWAGLYSHKINERICKCDRSVD